MHQHAENRLFRFFGRRFRNSLRWGKSYTPPKTGAKERARRARQAGHAHAVQQSQELEAQARKFRREKKEREYQLTLDRELYHEFMKTLKGSTGPRPTFRQWRNGQ